jgi:hypothetical protein
MLQAADYSVCDYRLVEKYGTRRIPVGLGGTLA